MNGFESRIELVHRARSGVQEMATLLLRPTPQAVEQCAARLEEAIGTVQKLENHLREPGMENPQALRAELTELRRELNQARALLAQAFEAHAAWYRLLSGLVGGYSREGTPAPPRPGGRIAMEA